MATVRRLESAASTIKKASSARLELLSGGASGASTYRVHGFSEPCVLKVVAAESAAHLRAGGRREIRFYEELAAYLPLRTPRVLASLVEASGSSALLLGAYTPVKPASELNGADFTEIAGQLAGFHAVYWGRTGPLDALAWLERPERPDLAREIEHASEAWRALARQPQFQDVLTGPVVRDLEAALAELATKPEHAPEAALTLCHGDCHTGNLLRDRAGRLVWADWQEVRTGHGPDDLAFLLQRAEADGAAVARDQVVAAYCDALETAGVEGVDPEAVTSAMNASERRTQLLYWPDYLADAEAGTMVRHLTRVFST